MVHVKELSSPVLRDLLDLCILSVFYPYMFFVVDLPVYLLSLNFPCSGTACLSGPFRGMPYINHLIQPVIKYAFFHFFHSGVKLYFISSFLLMLCVHVNHGDQQFCLCHFYLPKPPCADIAIWFKETNDTKDVYIYFLEHKTPLI